MWKLFSLFYQYQQKHNYTKLNALILFRIIQDERHLNNAFQLI